jgi:hypothetical protein
MYAKYDQMVEFLLIHHSYERSHDLERVAEHGWRSFGFPLMYWKYLVFLPFLGCRMRRDGRILTIPTQVTGCSSR